MVPFSHSGEMKVLFCFFDQHKKGFFGVSIGGRDTEMIGLDGCDGCRRQISATLVPAYGGRLGTWLCAFASLRL